jgi:hypothetical protein
MWVNAVRDEYNLMYRERGINIINGGGGVYRFSN